MSKPTADWVRVGDCFYRKIQLYADVFHVDLELEHYTVTGAPYSGAVGKHFTILWGESVLIWRDSLETR